MFYNVHISTVEHRYNLEVNIHILEAHAQNFFVHDGNIRSTMSGDHCSRVWADGLSYMSLF